MGQEQDRANRKWLAIGILFALFWGLCLALFGPGLPEPSLEGSGTGEPASYNWTLFDLDDRPTTLLPFEGRTVFLNIWATYCGPCLKEMPSIARLAENPRLKGRDIAFVCVSLDESSGVVKAFLEGRSWGMQYLRAEKLPAVFLADGMPATFIIAPDGRIAAKQVGPADWDREETVALLEKVAAEAPGPP